MANQFHLWKWVKGGQTTHATQIGHSTGLGRLDYDDWSDHGSRHGGISIVSKGGGGCGIKPPLLHPWFWCDMRPIFFNFFYVALSRPTVKCEKNRVGFFIFFLCQIWAKNLLKFLFSGLKKHLYMRFDCIPPEFSPFRNFKKNIGKLNSLTVG